MRELLGMFSLDSLAEVARALAAQDTTEAAQKMFAIVAELEANGRSLQHFSRELARYIRNLLVVRIAKSPTRLVAASDVEQKKLAEAGAPFSEEDLTRYLQITLDNFRDLQSSLQPRFHLEMGLLRMVHAGKLQPIEEALAEISGGVLVGMPVVLRRSVVRVRDQAERLPDLRDRRPRRDRARVMRRLQRHPDSLLLRFLPLRLNRRVLFKQSPAAIFARVCTPR